MKCLGTIVGFLSLPGLVVWPHLSRAAATKETPARMIPVYYVAPAGSDNNPGTVDQPFQSIARARDAVRRDPARTKTPITVQLQAGTYYLASPLVFTAADAGGPDAPVSYQAAPGAEVIISGGRQLELSWEPYRDGMVQARTPADIEIDALFVNGNRQPMARYPNYDAEILPYQGYAADAFSPERAARWADPTGGYIHAMHVHHWGGYHYRITGKNPDGTVAYEGGWQNNRQMGMHPKYRFVENIFEELDAPGEWYHDADAQTLYFYPPPRLDLAAATVEVTRLRHLVEFRGDQQHPVRHINLEGLTFRHARRTFMETREPLLRSDWTIYRGGAVVFAGAEDCAINDCVFDQVGGNAVFVSDYNRRIAVRGTHIRGAGASAVCFVGDPDAVRNPLFEYQERQAYADIDQTPGPKTDNYPADCLVEDSLIHDIGLVEKQATGVQISMARGITVRHCSIYDVGRAGINISEGTFGGHLIEFCDVFDTVRETGDHGSFNSWGRDRFWGLTDVPAGELPRLALLDTATTVIRNSRWRCDHGWDVDLDDGSSHYEIYNNLFLSGGLKLREGFGRKVYNNIAVNNTLHPHVWYKDSGDEVTRNIWMTAYRAARMKHWGATVDRNFFTRATDRDAFQKKGWDRHSLAGDPLFVDPANGDYRVQPGSPAREIGFENFPMDRFGVQKPALRAIARTPHLPRLKLTTREVAPRASAAAITWLGATLRELVGEEFSAFGVSKEDGGLQVTAVTDGSPAARAGLQEGDLVQQINGKPTRTAADVRRVSGARPRLPLTVGFVRGQQPQTATIR